MYTDLTELMDKVAGAASLDRLLVRPESDAPDLYERPAANDGSGVARLGVGRGG